MSPCKTIGFTLRTLLVLALCSLQLPIALGKKLSEEKLLRSTRDKLQGDYEDTDVFNLGERIQAAERVADRDQSPKSKKQLERLLEKREDIVASIEEASQSTGHLSQRVSLLEPHGEYIAADPELRSLAQESRLAFDLGNALRIAASSGDLKQLEESLQWFPKSRLRDVFSIRLQSALSHGILKRTEYIWNSSHETIDQNLATKIILKQLLGLPSEKLKFSLNIQEGESAATSIVQNSLKRTWENSFDLHFDNSERDQASKFSLKGSIAMSPLIEDLQTEDQTVSSKIPGRVKTVENPKFKKLLTLYEEADRSLQDAMDIYYDQEHRVYLEEISDIKTRSQRDVIAEARIENPDLSEQEILNTAEAVQEVENRISTEVHLRNLSTPELPEAPHERILKELMKTPPTIEETTEDEPYDYVRRSISLSLKTDAYFKLDTPYTSSSIERKPTLEHDNSWFENIGVHPRDNSPARGNYSESEKETARKLFLLSFSADCSRQMKSALSELSKSLWQKGQNENDPALSAFGLAIQLSQQPSTTTQLNLERLIELSKTLAPIDGAIPQNLNTLIVEFATPLATWNESPTPPNDL